MEPYHTVSVFSSKYEDVAIVMEKLPENFQEFSADRRKSGWKVFYYGKRMYF